MIKPLQSGTRALLLISPEILGRGRGWQKQRRSMLGHHALLVPEEGPRGVTSKEEVADFIEHHFGLLRNEFQVIRSSLVPFLLIFSERAARDVGFARGRVMDGPVRAVISLLGCGSFR
jgi:hypothetical protein